MSFGIYIVGYVILIIGLAIGAHVLKVGLSPLIVDLMEKVFTMAWEPHSDTAV